jgi:hypothetical protein
MNTKTRKYVLVCTVVVISFLLIGVASSFSAGEKQAKDAPSFTLSASFRDNLVMSQGQFAYVTLKSGNTLSGDIKEVKNGLLHLEKIEGRDYFDALIRVEDISAFEIQFRGF